ncbi:MAG: hydrogenase formation protein HypD [Candidatus Marinimicrobia bacterium]|nr:hydrogenase formation protein HypD [Candidatus Neomarinimicrobiota bacterium]
MNIKEFQNPKLIAKLVEKINEYKKPISLMEVCGSHTMAIGKWGIRNLLPKNIKLISGPGCPVCVTPMSIIDALLDLKNVTIAIFGDLMRVPGENGSLELAKAKGLDVKIVYSPMDALKLAEKKETVFVGIGFETTIPGIAHTIQKAYENKIKNFSVLTSLKTVPPALKLLSSDKDINLDGFILPGHVSVIIGKDAYNFLPSDYNIGGVVTGFEPADILVSVEKLIRQKENNEPKIENEYSRIVTNRGNIHAQNLMNKVLKTSDGIFRGIGEIPNSELKIREKYSEFDAEKKYNIKIEYKEDKSGCRCGDVLKGIIVPPECPLFGNKCTPSNPIGPCMVSSEGSCSAYFKYERNSSRQVAKSLS